MKAAYLPTNRISLKALHEIKCMLWVIAPQSPPSYPPNSHYEHRERHSATSHRLGLLLVVPWPPRDVLTAQPDYISSACTPASHILINGLASASLGALHQVPRCEYINR
uniref:Uncharacterized protein n=1 Tax=Mesocestoides corti TaxID=53468 RepID=A0A5K3FYW0_MESCO